MRLNKINQSHLNLIFFVSIYITSLSACKTNSGDDVKSDLKNAAPWHGWNKYQIKPEDSLARLGHDLIENTSFYFGPKGKIASITNGMNCQNCHMQGGIVPYGNNFSAVISTYPRFNNRSNAQQTIAMRVNDCFERSLNGKPIDSSGREMKALIAYFHWIGDDISKGQKPLGAGVMQLKYLNRAADPTKGKIVFVNLCQVCHGKDGEGKLNADQSGYIYPPLWGKNSYNSGAGLCRLSSFAGFVKNNMPYLEADYRHPKLSNEEAWDVAAFVNNQPRPQYDIKNDFPDISRKPIDNPSGPYMDTFSQEQHKYGPFQPIKLAMARVKN